MARRPYGTGHLKRVKGGWEIRWRETEIDSNGSKRRALRYEKLDAISKKSASDILTQRLATAGRKRAPARFRVTFRSLSAEWRAAMVPLYRPSTQKNHVHILGKHLLPRFGDLQLSEITRQTVQSFVTHLVQAWYAPKTIVHIHDVLSAVLRTAVNWGHLQENPARGVKLPELVTVRPKRTLDPDEASRLLIALEPLPKTLVGLAILTGLRRGELFALRWRSVDFVRRRLSVTEAVYKGRFGLPKTKAGKREIPLCSEALDFLLGWKSRARTTHPGALVFSTRSGKPISPNNILRQFIFPVCDRLNIPRTTWLTFRRTYASWSHDMGVPAKVLAKLMGHRKVDTTLDVYTQVVDGSLATANDRIGKKLFSIVQSVEAGSRLTH